MPLPAALAARLKKRGLITESLSQDVHEEIIAADYSSEDTFTHQTTPLNEDAVVPLSVGDSLPPGWFKVKDHISGYYYFWDSDKDLVSWLSPKDPKAQVTLPASKQKVHVVQDLQTKQLVQPQVQQPMPPGTEVRSSEEKERTSIGPIRPGAEHRKHIERSSPYQKPDRESHRHGKKKDEDLDPMDPSSYSDTPRGNWSSGLPKMNEAKTGVDTTANGPLFQMRPYPNPGAILRANANTNPGIGPHK